MYSPFSKPGPLKAYSFLWITGLFFIFSWIGQFIFQGLEQTQKSLEHGQPKSFWDTVSQGDFWASFLAATFENWQSEFLQLCWQSAGLAFLLYWGSSQSRESDDRMESMISDIHNIIVVNRIRDK